MWNKDKSLFLSRILTVVAAGVAIFVAFFIPTLSEWYQYMMTVEAAGILDRSSMFIPMCITLYVCDALALAALWNLHLLLGNISKDQVFIPKNTSCLRRISWIRALELHIRLYRNGSNNVRAYHEGAEECL